MAYIFYKRVKNHLMTIDEVPRLWRAAVQEMLENDPEWNPQGE